MRDTALPGKVEPFRNRRRRVPRRAQQHDAGAAHQTGRIGRSADHLCQLLPLFPVQLDHQASAHTA